MKATILSLVSFLTLFSASAVMAVDYQNPVMAGDFPDPSVVRVGEDYWATATSSEWGRLFPILHSRDLVNWELKGHIFTNKPAWSSQNYWAPEIHHYKGKFFVYYVGRHAENNRLHIAVATAENPLGPWTDHGTLVGQEDGSIDAVIETDEKGDQYMLWKNDGNSRKQPTYVYAQKLSADGLKLVGERKQLLRNDQPWEGPLIEGPDVLKHGDYYYMFYAGNGCCGRQCTYGTGVARSKSLLGPYEKFPGNPIITHNEEWRCPGHGTTVSTADGRDYYLYHAYDAKDTAYVGRQGVLDEITWGNDGWPVINSGRGVSVTAKSPHGKAQTPLFDFEDDFTDETLSYRWQWPHVSNPKYKISQGELIMASAGKGSFLGNVVAVQTTAGNYSATARVNPETLKDGMRAGLFAFGDRQNAIGVVMGDGKAEIIKRQKNQQESLGIVNVPNKGKVYLRMTAKDGFKFRFDVWAEDRWIPIGRDVDILGDYLPPWDRGLRVALAAGGSESGEARYDWLRVINK